MPFFREKRQDSMKMRVRCASCGCECVDGVCKRCNAKTYAVSKPEANAGTPDSVPSSDDLLHTRNSERVSNAVPFVGQSETQTNYEKSDSSSLISYEPKIAPFLRRLGAALIDHGVIGFVWFALGGLLLIEIALLFAIGAGPPIYLQHLIMISMVVCSLLGGVLYYAWFESSHWQATPGKRFCNLQVIGLHHETVGFRRAFAKAILQYVAFCILAVAAAVAAGLLSHVFPVALDKESEYFYLFAFKFVLLLAAAFFMCVSCCRGRSQSLLDFIVGRLVVIRPTITNPESATATVATNAAKPESAKIDVAKTVGKWNSGRNLFALFWLLTCIPLVAFHLYSGKEFIDCAKAFTQVDQAIKNDPDIQSVKTEQVIETTLKSRPGLKMAFDSASNAAGSLKQDELADQLHLVIGVKSFFRSTTIKTAA